MPSPALGPAVSPLPDADSRLIEGPEDAPATLVLAHGAGAPMDSPFMATIAAGLASRGWRVVRFEFPYMARWRESGRRGAPDRLPKLLESFRAQIELAASLGPLFIGGKSLGGRVASLVLSELQDSDPFLPEPAAGVRRGAVPEAAAVVRGPGVRGAAAVVGGPVVGGAEVRRGAVRGEDVRGGVCLGYPFHPPGKPERLRTAHLAHLRAPLLILQGERDSFGNRSEVQDYALSASVELGWIPGGDHSFKPNRASGLDEAAALELAVAQTDAFLRRVLAG